MINFQAESLYPDKTFTLEDFELGPSLGKGKFSEVFLARDKVSGYIVAIKIMEK